MIERIPLSTGTKWEKEVGYSRAIRIGPWIEVSGTTAINEAGDLVGKDDPFAQTTFILEKIEQALSDLGGSRVDVVRTRMFVTNISRWADIGRAHGAFFSEIRPVTTMVEVSQLIDPDMLVEIEVSAWVSP